MALKCSEVMIIAPLRLYNKEVIGLQGKSHKWYQLPSLWHPPPEALESHIERSQGQARGLEMRHSSSRDSEARVCEATWRRYKHVWCWGPVWMQTDTNRLEDTAQTGYRHVHSATHTAERCSFRDTAGLTEVWSLHLKLSLCYFLVDLYIFSGADRRNEDGSLSKAIKISKH